MELPFLIKGLILGFSIAAPVGPIGVLCIRKTIQFGRLSGLLSGLGAATADAIFGVISAFGLTLISNVLIAGQFWLHLIGGLFLLYLGIKTFVTKPVEHSKSITRRTLLGDFVSTFFLTITNPVTILSFIAVFAGLGLATTNGDYLDATLLVCGVFLGSMFWWLLLSEGVTLFRKKISLRVMSWINRVAGSIIIAFGVAALWRIIR